MKKFFALLLAALMLLGALSACSSTEQPGSEPMQDASSGTATDPTNGSDETPDTDPVDTEPTPAVENGLPIVAEPTTFSVWAALDIGAVGMDDMNESPTWQRVAELTNVSLDWTLASTSAKSEQFNLMLVSEQYDDAINNGSWNQNLSYYMDQDVIIDLADLIADYAPNYTAVRNSDEVVYRDTMLDDGSIGAFHRVLKSRQPSWFGLVVRDDLLTQLDLAIPTTLDEVETVLTAFQDAGVEAPLGFASDGMDGVFLASYGLAGGMMQGNWLQVDGEAQYAPVMPELKDYLIRMHDWYTRGLIDQEFYGDDPMGFRFDDVAAGMSGMFSTMSNVMSQPVRLSEIEGFSLLPIATPMANAGESRKIALCTSVLNRVELASTFCITTACADAETLVKFIDFFFTEQGAELVNWGLQGETYLLDENGVMAYTDLLLDNPDDFTQRQAKLKYGIDQDAVPHLYDWEAQIGDMIPNAKLVYSEGAWDVNYEDERTWPAGVSLSLEETEVASAVLGDIETYVDEMIVKFIIGQESLDNFDTYVERIYGMGLQDAIDAYQAAYDRYMARG